MGQRVLPIPAALEFYNHRNPAVDRPEHLRKERNRFLRAKKRHRLQLLERIGIDPRVHPAGTQECVVVKHHDLLILGELNVQFHAVVRPNRRLKRGNRVFRHALVGRKQSPMRKRAPRKTARAARFCSARA